VSPAVRLATEGDVRAIAALVDAAYQHYVPVLGRKPRPMFDDHAARTANGGNFVVDEAGDILAVIALTPEPSGALHIFNIAIRPDAQGRGLLRDLLAFAEAEAHRQGAAMLTLYTNELMTRNRAIYSHLGFAEVGIEQANGYNIVFMQRPVPAA
jgi:N-acetylglutamate synthase-like GNAT family acetyltransferase